MCWYIHILLFCIVVVLSLSVSVSISYVPHLPSAGETLSATKFQNDFGGKAANQCVTAAKLGSKAALISKVCKINCFAWQNKYHKTCPRVFVYEYFQLGGDEWADKYDENLKKCQVDTRHVQRVDGQKTGIAQINVAENGENQIVIVPGANNSLSPADVEHADELLKASKVNQKFNLFRCAKVRAKSLVILIGCLLQFI